MDKKILIGQVILPRRIKFGKPSTRYAEDQSENKIDIWDQLSFYQLILQDYVEDGCKKERLANGYFRLISL